MSKNEDKIRFNRRNFLKRSAGASFGFAGVASTLAQLELMQSAVATTTSMNTANYKALVCVFLRGGCDMNNMLVPIGTNPQAQKYKAERGVAAVPELISEEVNQNTLPSIERNSTEVSPLNLTGDDAMFGMHPRCTRMTNLFNQGKLGWINNVANLVVPTNSSNYGSVPRPLQLFSHSNQVNEWMSGIADQPFVTGWGGRLAEIINAQNTESQSSMLITASGNQDFMVTPGASGINQYTISSSGAPVGLQSVGTNPTGSSDEDRRLKAALDLMNFNSTHIIETSYNSVLKRAIANKELIGAALDLTDPASGDYIGFDVDAIFAANNATSSLANEIKAIARLIIGRRCLGNERQIFFCDHGGFDNHNNINANQGNRLEEVDEAIGAFNQCMEDYAAFAGNDNFDYNQVTTFEMSDFNRTWTPNGDDFGTSGTDHAWGTHAFIMGGAVQAQQNILNGGVDGGRFYGTFPTLDVGASQAVPGNARGRWIPTTSKNQMAARLAAWFGVSTGPAEDTHTIFPNLSNFPDPFTSGNLDFIA
ncbi:MAG: DUF1501 domain-containing protein [Acidimicrobiia bacterium]